MEPGNSIDPNELIANLLGRNFTSDAYFADLEDAMALMNGDMNDSDRNDVNESPADEEMVLSMMDEAGMMLDSGANALPWSMGAAFAATMLLAASLL